MSLNVNEIFYSLQGEGARMGEASIFIRLTKCNLSCDFCDTDFAHGTTMSVTEILDEIRPFGCRWIVWTGGEPTLQLTDEIVAFFKENGYFQAIETNGTREVPRGLDYIACSPKSRFETVKNVIPEVDELRFPMRKGDALPDVSTLPKAKRYLLSPVFDEQAIVRENVEYCVGLIKKNWEWGLSLQMHKLIEIQ